MGSPAFNAERASKILVEADFANDDEVAERWGITSRTIRNYRSRLETDKELSMLFQLKKQMFCRSWVDDASETIKVGATRLKQLIRVASTEEDAKVIHAIAGACKIMGELNIAYTALTDEPSPDLESSKA